jgi:antitoxin (DNA-binding transcriptional repressor) of toxin-antitoxin stability system
METITEFEAAKNFPELLKKIEAGEKITITRDGEPLATINPWHSLNKLHSQHEALSKWMEFGKKLSLDLTIEELLEMRDEGRK